MASPAACYVSHTSSSPCVHKSNLPVLVFQPLPLHDLQSTQVWVNESLALFEQDFPRSEALYTMCQMSHLTQHIRDHGPLRDT